MPDILESKSSRPTKKQISLQLERILNSPDFRASPQQIAFLKFVVFQTLAGNASVIKGYTVATEVFGRGPGFDQTVDPVVSIQGSRLRRALERYYLTAGKHDPIRIDIPRGTYVPTFCDQQSCEGTIDAEFGKPIDAVAPWPIVLIRPLENLTGNPDDDDVSAGLTVELAHSLCHFREIRVLEPPYRGPESAFADMDADFVLTGNIRRDPERVTVAIRLIDAKNGFQIWSGKYSEDIETARMISFQEDVAAEVAARVTGGYAEIPRYLAELTTEKTKPDLTTYEAMLRFWKGDTLLSPEVMKGAIRALEVAVVRDPDHGQTWSMLAGLYANNYGLEIIDMPAPLDKAEEFACRGVSLDPTTRRARMILGYVHVLQSRLLEARHEAEKAYHLNQDSLMVLDRIGWLTALAGEWERGIGWIEKAIKANPYYRPWVRHALCFNWLRSGNFEMAHRETLSFMMPDFFWDQMMKASTCGLLGRTEEGQAHARALLALKPDFMQRGRILIGNYVKLDHIADRILEGLDRLGMNIEK